MSTPDLFDSPADHALQGYLRAFDGWAAAASARGQFKAGDSLTVFHTMWMALAKWSLSQQPPISTRQLTAVDLEQFLSKRAKGDNTAGELSARYAWRMLNLIDRVLSEEARSAATTANRCAHELMLSRPEWRFANSSANDPSPDYLSAAQAKDLVNYLSQARPRPGRRGPDHTWQESRNRATVAVQLGAGLTPAEVRALTLQCVISQGGSHAGVPWKLRVAAHGLSHERETPIAGWAGQVMKYWLEVREQTQIAGDYAFPSTRTGKPLGKVAQYEATRQVMEASGLEKALVSGGSFRMRHTFALRQLRRGKNPDEVARWLGMKPAEMNRYLRLVSAPISDVA